MAKKIIWELNEDILFISEESKEAEVERDFSFKLTRYKNKVTHEESLRIESLYKGQQNGHIDTYIYNLDKDLPKLMRYGVAFSGVVFGDLKMTIQNIYLSLEPVELTSNENTSMEVDEKRMEPILRMIGEVINVFGVKDKYCHIPVEQFNLLITESEFSDCDLMAIKRRLSDGGFIKCGTGRFTNLVRISDKPVRVISFIIDKMKDYIPKNDTL